MKSKILVFFSSDIYPKGGMRDLVGEAGSIEEAESMIIKLQAKNDDPNGLLCWWQLVERDSLQIIKRSEDE